MEPALGIRRCPLVQLALEVKYPPLSHIELGERRARVHRRPPSVQPCRVLTGPLRHVPGFPRLGLLRVLRHVPTATADGAPAPSPKGLAGTAGTLPTFTIDRSAGSAPSSTPGASSRATATRHATSTARSRNGRLRRSPAQTRTEDPNSPQPPVSGLLPSLGASNTGSSPTPFCRATAPSPLAADRCSIVRGCSRPPPHLWSQTAPQLPPAVTAAGGGSFHPTRSYGASWRTLEIGESGDWLVVRASGPAPISEG